MTSPKKSQPPRLLALVLAAVVGALLFFVGVTGMQKRWRDRQLDKRFAVEGVHTPARLVGYKYIKEYGKGAQSGDRPLFAYTADDGIERVHLAKEYGVIAEYGKKTLSTQKIEMTYLPTEPGNARILRWYSSRATVGLIVSMLMCFFSVFIMLGAILGWFVKPKLRQSAGESPQ